MAYAYTAWITQSTSAAKLAMLNLHIAEVMLADAGGPDVSSDGKSVQRGSQGSYLRMLLEQQARLENATGTGAADRYSVMPVRRP